MRSLKTTSRRDFIRAVGSGVAALTFAQALPAFARSLKDQGSRSLVIIQLAGGNDGFNTLVPLHRRDYFTQRPTLALTPSEVVPVSELFAFNRELSPLLPLFNEGKLTVVPHVGYPLVSDSHHRSTEIWHTASNEEISPTHGWAGRALAQITQTARATNAFHGATFTPHILYGAPEIARLRTAGESFTTQLGEVAERIATTDASEVFFVTLTGFDTHYGQAPRHRQRLNTFANALAQFQRRINQRGRSGRVTTVAFSEFGRSLAENDQGGTDHGSSAPVFLFGENLTGGIYRESSDAIVDFRHLVSTLASERLGSASHDVNFPALPLLSASNST